MSSPSSQSRLVYKSHNYKSHNVSVLLYHFVCPTKYRRSVITAEVDAHLKDICLGIAARYEIEFLEIGADHDHVHFLIQSVPTYSPTQIIRIIKSLTAKELFSRLPGLKKQLWGSSFWSSGFFVDSVGRYGSEQVIRRYVQNQGVSQDYQQIHTGQLDLFEQGESDTPGKANQAGVG